MRETEILLHLLRNTFYVRVYFCRFLDCLWVLAKPAQFLKIAALYFLIFVANKKTYFIKASYYVTKANIKFLLNYSVLKECCQDISFLIYLSTTSTTPPITRSNPLLSPNMALLTIYTHFYYKRRKSY